MVLLKGAIKINIVLQYHYSYYILLRICSGGITVTFSGEDLNVVPTTLVIDIVDNIENLDNTTTSILVYNIVSTYRDCISMW